MTEPCPTIGFMCVDELRSRVQAVTDQIVGFAAFIKYAEAEAISKMILAHYVKLSELLQQTLDGYTEGHGSVPMTADVDAMGWLLRETRS